VFFFSFLLFLYFFHLSEFVVFHSIRRFSLNFRSPSVILAPLKPPQNRGSFGTDFSNFHVYPAIYFFLFL
jgi:hypothetical protein